MNEYTIFADSACDIPVDMLNEWGVKHCDLSLLFTEKNETIKNSEIAASDFYARMRNGEVATTSAVNAGDFKKLFEEELIEGKDVFYLGFSSGISATYNSAVVAAQELQEKYPQRKVITVDSLCASVGFGFLLYLCVKQKENGKNIDELEKYATDSKLHVCHWFTVDDLVYLRRGGRVSGAAATVATILNIKPVLHVDNEGKLINMYKVRGRKKAVHALADNFGKLACQPYEGTIFIGHGDCLEDAKALEKILNDEYGASVDLITDVGPVIGAHSGPGTLALFFIGNER